jgi:hypothetical protein
VPSLAVAIERLDLIGGSAELRSVAVEGAQLDLRRESGGEMNLAALMPRDTAPSTAGAPFRFHVANAALNHGTVRIVDDAVSPALAATLNEVTVELTNLASAAGQKATVALAFATDAGERVSHRGTLALEPLSADGRLEITGLKLQRLLPYYASALNLAVDDGALDLATDVRYAGGTQALALANLGATVRELKMRLPDQKELLWRVPMLEVRGGSVDISKQVVSFEAVEGRGAATAIRRDGEGRFNFARLIRTQTGGAETAGGAAGWRVEASKVALDDFSATLPTRPSRRRRTLRSRASRSPPRTCPMRRSRGAA